MTTHARDAWPPEGLDARELDDGSWRIPVSTRSVDLGQVLDGTVVRLHVPRRAQAEIAADGIGRGARLHIQGEAGCNVTLPEAARRVDLDVPSATLRLRGARTSVHVHEAGRLVLVSAPGEEEVACQVRCHADDTVTIGGDVELRHLTAASHVNLQTRLDRAATVEVAGNLTAQVLDVDAADVTGTLTAQELAAGTSVTCARATIHGGRPGQSGLVRAGVTIAASETANVQGPVQGTDANPVNITAGDGGSITVGPASHCTLAASSGELASVIAEALTDCEVSATSTLEVRRDLRDTRAEASGRIIVGGGCERPTWLAAPDLTIGRATAGPGHLAGEHISLGPTERPDTDQPPSADDLLRISVGRSLRAATPAALDIQADGSGPVRVGVGTREHLPEEDPPTSAADGEIGFDFPHPTQPGLTTPVALALTGQMTVAVATDCRLARLTEVHHLTVGGRLTLPEGASDCAEVAARGTIDLARGTLQATNVVARSISNGVLHASGNVAANTADELALTCQDLTLQAETESLQLTATGDVTVEGPVTGASEISIHGDASLHELGEGVRPTLRGDSTHIGGDAPKGLVWRPWQPGATLEVAGHVGHTSVECPSGEAGRLALAGGAALESLTLTGACHIDLSWHEADELDRIGAITLADASSLTLEAGTAEARSSVRLKSSDATGDVRLTGTGTAVLDLVGTGRDGTLRMACDPHTGCRLHADPITQSLEELPRCHLRHGRFTVDGDHRHIHAGDDTDIAPLDIRVSDHRPLLIVTATGFIDRISGEFALARSDGRIVGRRPQRRRRLPGAPTGESPEGAAAVLVDLKHFPEDERGPLNGTMVHVDVSQVEFAELQRLKDLHVFSPLAGPLRDLARQPGTRTSQHDTAQRLATIAELTSRRAVSGATRSAALWASTRAHHRTTRGIEKAARWLHWAVGYSQRVGPAFLTFLGAWLAGVIIVTLGESAACYDPATPKDGELSFQPGPYSFYQQALRILLVPLSLLRLAATEGQGYAPVFCNPFGQLLVTVGVGLPLVFLVVAIRNYLRSPAD